MKIHKTTALHWNALKSIRNLEILPLPRIHMKLQGPDEDPRKPWNSLNRFETHLIFPEVLWNLQEYHESPWNFYRTSWCQSNSISLPEIEFPWTFLEAPQVPKSPWNTLECFETTQKLSEPLLKTSEVPRKPLENFLKLHENPLDLYLFLWLNASKSF